MFVRNPTEDVAAMTITTKQIDHAHEITFWLAMNGGCDSDSIAFAQEIIDVANRARGGDNRSSCISDLLYLVISHCLEKINRRRAKIAQRLSELIKTDALNFSEPITPQILTAFNADNLLENGSSLKT